MEPLDEALDVLQEMLVSGIRNSAPLVRRCGELADELAGADLAAVAEHLRAVPASDDDRGRIAAVFRALLALKHARLQRAKPVQIDEQARR